MSRALLATSLLLAALSPARAAAPSRLGEYFEKRIAYAEKAMRNPALGEALGRAKLESFHVEFTAQASFGVSEVAEITVSPEIDLVFVPPAENPPPSP